MGRKVLIITRAEREDGLHEPVASFINWSFFEAGAVNLEEIEIPVETVTGKILRDEKLLLRMVSDTESNLDVIRKKLPLDLASRIQADLQLYRDNMPDILRAIGDLPISGHRGTAFLILPVDPILEHDIDEQNDEEQLPAPLLKTLRGFSNTMIPSDIPPPMVASFYDHGRDGKTVNLIGDEEFFTPGEFLNADQHFEGTFDEYGQFVGAVKVYREEPAKDTVPWDGARGEPTRCGPFRVKIAYLQGLPKETLLPQEEFVRMMLKLNRFGGLYVYRDGVRVLPYGNSDYDFLNIERRRTKSASDWFFSYRRVFGAVELTREHNGALVEKAGREGFRGNIAYRQFRAILENFFKRLAVDWFREKTATYGNFRGLKEEVTRRAEVIEKREKQSTVRRKRLKDRVDNFFEEVEQGLPARETLAIRQSLDERLNHIVALSPEDSAREFLRLEAQLSEALHTLRERFRIPRPRNLALTRSLQKDVERSASVTLRLEAELFTPLEREIDERISGAVTDARALVSRRRRIKLVIQTREARETRKAKIIVRDTRLEAESLSKEVLRLTRESLSTVDQAFKLAVMDLEREQLADLDEEEVRRFGLELEERLNTAVIDEIELLERIRDQIQAVLEAVSQGVSLEETTAAYEERSKILEEQLDHYTELAQLGTAIGIIQHEFNATVDSLHQGLKDLRSWAVLNPETEKTYNALRSSFEHLDAYLAMFRPLRRRLYRKAVPITGKMIRTYLLEIFGDRFKRHRVDWKTSEAFEMHTIEDYPSVFLPPFVNIVDNALIGSLEIAPGKNWNMTSSAPSPLTPTMKDFL